MDLIRSKEIVMVPISDVKLDPKNRNKHPEDQIERLKQIIRYQGFRNPIVISNRTGFCKAGEGRVLAARALGLKEVPAIFQDFESEEQETAYGISDNAIALWAELDFSGINTDVPDLGPDFDIDLLGIKNFGIDANDKVETNSESGSLSKSFLVPPFTVLDARQGYWLDRKREWVSIGIKSEQGRGDAKTYNTKGSLKKDGILDDQENVSIFDPVLCELAYLWFSPKNGTVLDPFAGGSVRGVVASKLGRQYVGIDLREEQIEENRKQADLICNDPIPVWKCGDSLNISNHCLGMQADLIFSCPPYADLEVYSDDERDLSTMEYAKFIDVYRQIVKASCDLLKENRFACFVVGEVRDAKGIYYNFLGDTIKAFLDCGMKYYNEAAYLTPNGTLALRAAKQMNASRKLGKGHQNLLVFVKGDPKIATRECGSVVIDESLFDSGVGAGD